MPRFPWDRSRIFLAFFSCVVLAPLCVHRLNLLLNGGEYAFPSDRYWTLFLGWYLLLWVVALAYLLFVWVREHRSGNRPHVPFFEGVVGSLFFYHGLPPKSRVVTFTAGFLLGGVPSYFAVHISPSDPAGFQIATWLIVPVAVLTIGGSLYTMRWLMEFERSAERKQAAPDIH